MGRPQHWETISDAELIERLARWLDGRPGTVRVALDGSDHLGPSLVAALGELGRPAVDVRAALFWRDKSLRLELGRTDVESFLGWLDTEALRREVLIPALANGTYLPSLRDPETNRSTHATVRPAPAGTVVLVSGDFLLGHGLPFDRTVHVQVSAVKRAERVPASLAWTLPAYERYAAEVRPGERADVVIKVDRRHPAVRGLP